MTSVLPVWDPGVGVDTGPALSLLDEMVRCESPSNDSAAVQNVLVLYRQALEDLDVRTQFFRGDGTLWDPECGDAPILQGDAGPLDGEPLLIVGHADTVHPHGTLDGPLPLARSGQGSEARLYGPGVYDMKGGMALMWGALHALHTHGIPLRRPVRILVTPDEEIGSVLSRNVLESRARHARGALIPEPCLPGGDAKIRRKGVGEYRIQIQGVPAHAGIEPEKGASAIHALADVIPQLLALADPSRGTTLNLGSVRGGTANNVVAATSEVTVDVRMKEASEASRVADAIRRVSAQDPRIRVDVLGGINRPPMEPSEASMALFEAARLQAKAMGTPSFGGGETGGGSDGNLLSAVGCPVLDGLGPQGSGAHTLEENILLSDVPWRIRFYARLLQCL